MHPIKKSFILTSLFLVFILVSWFFQKMSIVSIIQLVLGFIIGNIVLEIDHFLYWYIYPDTQESQIGQKLVKNFQIKKLISFYQQTKPFHNQLVLHHIYSQICLTFLVFFIVTSADTYLGRSIAFFTSLNLLISQIFIYKKDKQTLQSLLFANLPKQLSVKNIFYYLLLISLSNLFFFVKMINQ